MGEKGTPEVYPGKSSCITANEERKIRKKEMSVSSPAVHFFPKHKKKRSLEKVEKSNDDALIGEFTLCCSSLLLCY